MGFQKGFYPAKIYKWHRTPLPVFKEMLIGRRDNELDNMILVTGSRGAGKSTFTGKVLFQFEDFDPYESIVYSKEALFKLIKKVKGYVWADEGVVNAAKGNVMSRANKMLFEVSTINRDNKNMVFFLMPYVEDFDSKILQYCSAWIHIDSRGLGVLLLPSNKGLFGRNNWDIKNLKKIYDEFMKEQRGVTHVPYWVYENFRGYITFGKMTVQQQAIVDEIKKMRKNENLDKQMQEEVKVEVSNMENYSKYSAKKLSELISKGEIRSIEQFNKTCEQMKLSPEEMLKKCDSIFKKSGAEKSARGTLRQTEKEDLLIKF